MKTLFEHAGEFTITLEQRESGKFRVTYGKQVRDYLDYADAACDLGKCLMHDIACSGQMDLTE